MAILDFLKTTNYPNALLENTFGNQYFKDVVNPAKTGTGAKPPLGQLIKNWNPIKAFSPTMLKTGPTTGGMITVNISGNVMSENYTEDVIVPHLKEALRRGEDIGIG